LKKTLQVINSLIDLGLIRNYAIGGAMGQFYYIEAGSTFDLDIMVHLNSLIPLQEIYQWAKVNNYPDVKEHIIIEGIPVQFLPAFNDLISDAIENSNKVTMFGVESFVMKPEYLMAIMLKTDRSIDRTRLVKFFEECDFDKNLLELILKKFSLLKEYNLFKEKFL
jgi:hypothetical protein